MDYGSFDHPDYIQSIYEKQAEIAIKNLEMAYEAVGKGRCAHGKVVQILELRWFDVVRYLSGVV